MKKRLKVGFAALVLALAVPVVSYRTVRPCEMLRRELVRDSERQLEAARDTVRRAAGALGEEAQDAADAVASTVQHLTAGLVAGAAAAKVEGMSAPACVRELVGEWTRRD
jgi:hypothetical protein